MANSAVPRAVGPVSFWVNLSRALRGQVRHRALRRVGALVEVVPEDDDPLLDTLNTKIPALPGVIANSPLVYLKQSDLKENWGSQ
ncbi:MAG: hypothetical protein K0U70_05275 [Actinomycetia bacterium]|nr:hypothetical protein [Actinomycetes bacterium]